MGRFRKSSKVLIEGRLFSLQKELEPDTWQLEDEITGRAHIYTRGQLNALLKSNKLTFARGDGITSASEHKHIDLTEQQIETVKIRRSYVMAVQGVPSSSPLMLVAIQQVWDKLRQPASCPHPVTVQRWRRKYEAAENESMALLPQTHKRGNRKPRYEKEVVAFVQRAIDEKYMTRERLGIEETLNYAKGLILKENRQRPAGDQLKIPARGMVNRLIQNIPAYDKVLARFGFHVAKTRFRAAKGHVVTDGPLERAEIDHTLLDIIVVDEDTALPLGRPWLTLCVDHFTRCVLGIHIGFDPPSYLSVAKCLRHAVLPKDDLKTTHPEIKNDWLAHGVMSEIVVDNGQEFHGNSFSAACLSLNVTIIYSANRSGWFKPIVERLLGTINREVAHTQPGSTFSNIFEKGDYNASKAAVLRLSTLRTILIRWIVDVYHQKPHSTLGCSPSEHWAANTHPEDIRLPDDVFCLDAMLGAHEERTLTHQGIQYANLFYNSIELADLRRRLGEKLKVDTRVDKSDLGHIYVLPPDTRVPIRVPCLKLDYANGLSKWQHDVCQNFADRKYERKTTCTDWLEAKLELAEACKRELMFKKQATRKGLARFKQKAESLQSSPGNALVPTRPLSPQNMLPLNSDGSQVQGASLIDVEPAVFVATYRQRETGN